MSVKDIDRGWIQIKKMYREANNSRTKVGFPMGAPVKAGMSPGSGSEPASNISEVAFIATIQEFGAEQTVTAKQAGFLQSQGFPVSVGTKLTTPERSFMRTSFDESLPELEVLRGRLFDKLLRRQITVRTALGLIGEFMVNKIQDKIRNIKSPPNHPFTIARKKGSTNPLIDKGQMIQSVTHMEIIK